MLPDRPSPITITATDGAARTGTVRTAHGTFETPAFMAVGTVGSVKAVTPEQVRAAGIGVVLGNTYHLMLRPGCETVAALGGLHRFTGFNCPMLTDSGGFQVFSLASRVKSTEGGVEFASHIDGAPLSLSPESSMEAQRLLGADIAMQFDDVPALPSSAERVHEACERSIRWAARSRAAHTGHAHQGHEQLLFGIQQGGLDATLRRRSIDALASQGFDGYAIGGLSVGEAPADMHAAFRAFAPMLPAERPRYIMGIGFPEDLLVAIASGADMFDCVLPTRCARHGLALTSRGRVLIKNAGFARDAGPLDPACSCYTCTTFSLGYLRHLMKSGELLGHTLLTIHNLAYYASLMQGARAAIREQRFAAWHVETAAGWKATPADAETAVPTTD
jgi:queuine tRNA-ribosyltransferase